MAKTSKKTTDKTFSEIVSDLAKEAYEETVAEIASVSGTEHKMEKLETQVAKLLRYVDFLHKNHPNKLVTLKQWEAKTDG